MRDLIKVLTTPREPNYVGDTLRSLDAAGAAEFYCEVVCDGASMVPPDYGKLWQMVTLGDEPQGNLRAFFAVLARAYDQDVDRLFYFEDDIVACCEAVTRMAAVGVPDDCAFTAFFDMKELAPGVPDGLFRVAPQGVDGAGWWGFQAVLFPRRTITWLLSKRDQILATAKDIKHCSDFFVGDALLRSPWPEVAVHNPSLFEHVGAETSSIWPRQRMGVNRRARNFDGELAVASDYGVYQTAAVRAVGPSSEFTPGRAIIDHGVVRKQLDDDRHTYLCTLLERLRKNGFSRAPLCIGRRPDGWSMFDYIEGFVPTAPHPIWSDEVLNMAADLIQAFHIALDLEYCHGDLAPQNTVFRDGIPWGLIDFDRAEKAWVGNDVAYAAWTWLDLGRAEIAVDEQRRRLDVFAREYVPPGKILDVLPAIMRVRADDPNPMTAAWAKRSLAWCTESGLFT